MELQASSGDTRRYELVLEALRILATHPDGMSKDDLCAQISASGTLRADETELVSSHPRYQIHIGWGTSDAVRAGWLNKSGDGWWLLTPDGRHGLELFPDAIAFRDEARRVALERESSPRGSARPAYIVSSSQRNWAIAVDHGAWGIRAGNMAGVGTASRLEPPDVLAFWVSGRGFVALARVIDKPAQPWPHDIAVPWPDHQEYAMRIPFEVVEEFDPPVQLTFPNNFSRVLRLPRTALFGWRRLDDAQLQRLLDLAHGALPLDTDLPLRRAWLVSMSPASEYKDIEGAAYHYPLDIPNARLVEEDDVLVCYRPLKSSPDPPRIFGVGRVGQIHSNDDNHATATFDRYLALATPVTFASIGGDPRTSKQHSISPLPRARLQTLVSGAGLANIDSLPPVTHAHMTPQEAASLAPPPTFDQFTYEVVLQAVNDKELQLAPETLATAVAALYSGKHLMLTGPPGTGKTTFAKALAEAAQRVGLTSGWHLATATADWSSADTVGGYWRGVNQQLAFRPGQVLQAIDSEAWLIIDELNRADIDKAFGQLFTVLSGQEVTLPFSEVRDHVSKPASIVPEGRQVPPGTHPHEVRANWRLIATVNSRDRDLLFSMSYALLRRFAIVEVANPSYADYISLLQTKAPTGNSKLDARIAALISLPHCPLGPAILLDCAHYLVARGALGTLPAVGSDEAQLLAEALVAFVLPQLGDLSRTQLRDALAHLRDNVLPPMNSQEVARLFWQVLRVPATELIEQPPAALLNPS